MNITRSRGLLALALLPLGCAAEPEPIDAPAAGDEVPAHVDTFGPSRGPRPIDRTYQPPSLPAHVANGFIVLLREGADPAGVSEALVAKYGGVRGHVYSSLLKGFSVVNLPDGALEALRRDDRVASVEEERSIAPEAVQTNPGWALDRLDDAKGLDGSFSYQFNGTGVHMYFVDCGIHGNQAEFTNRLDESVDIANGDDPWTDATGHGTAVASVAAGTVAGVAKNAAIHSVKVANYATGLIKEADLIAGLEWVGQHAKRPAVVNSSNFAPTAAVAAAMTGLLQKGIPIVKSSGNYGWEGCQDPTNAVTNVLAVGAMDKNDAPASFTSYGPCVPIHAPGVDVKIALPVNPPGSTWDSQQVQQFGVWGGTSFSSPYVAGVVATMLQQNTLLTPAAVKAKVLETAWTGKLTGLKAGTPNRVVRSNVNIATIAATTIDTDTSTAEPYSWFGYFAGYEATYKWERSINNGPWTVVGTSYTYTTMIQPHTSYSMRLRQTTISPYSGVPRVTTTSVSVEDSSVCLIAKLCN